jgi:hypothetical protein
MAFQDKKRAAPHHRTIIRNDSTLQGTEEVARHYIEDHLHHYTGKANWDIWRLAPGLVAL